MWRGDGPSVLAEKLADLLVHVTQKVHVRSAATGTLVLDQEVPEYELSLVFLFHHHKLKPTEREKSERERGSSINGN